MSESGEINFTKLIHEIKRNGYDRFLTVEIYSQDEHPLESAIKSKIIIDSLLNRANYSIINIK